MVFVPLFLFLSLPLSLSPLWLSCGPCFVSLWLFGGPRVFSGHLRDRPSLMEKVIERNGCLYAPIIDLPKQEPGDGLDEIY